jgi:hypothetical protein
MTAILRFLIGWARIISGTFSPTEIAMTLIVGLASIVGIVTAVRNRTAVRALPATIMVLFVALLQVAAVRISFLPQIAQR